MMVINILILVLVLCIVGALLTVKKGKEFVVYEGKTTKIPMILVKGSESEQLIRQSDKYRKVYTSSEVKCIIFQQKLLAKLRANEVI
jgi:hypothetical protein